MECEIVVREATPRDLEQRVELVRRSITEYDFDAFILFFFQELTLQVCVLCGAVLFIFVGAAPAACALVPLGAAAALCGAVRLAHRARAAAAAQHVREEAAGFVAERRGRVLATASVSACWGPRRSGWLHALAVDARWRRRGLAAALLAECRAYALNEGLESLETVTSELQGSARSLLHTAGWELRGSYQRPVLGAALTLSMAQLGMELPHA